MEKKIWSIISKSGFMYWKTSTSPGKTFVTREQAEKDLNK